MVGFDTVLIIADRDEGLRRSVDGGISWKNIDGSKISAFSIDGNKIYAGQGEVILASRTEFNLSNKIIVSEDMGDHWALVDSGFPAKTHLTSFEDSGSLIAAIHAYDSHLVVGMRSWWGSGTAEWGVYHFVHNHDGWIIVDSSLNDENVIALTGHKLDFYVATQNNGIFHSPDGGSSWINISEGLLDRKITSMAISGQHLFIISESGVWKRPLSEITQINDDDNNKTSFPGDFHLSQNYPNPFNPVTKINYAVPERSFISLKVYNILGQEMATLFEGVKDRGKYVLTFDASSLASGIYIYRLRCEEISISKKLVLIK